jgi:hypothetical protein
MTLPSGEDQSPAQKASAVKRLYQAELMSKANVVGVGVGYRQKDGQRTDTVALVVMVTQKVPNHQLDPQDVIPAELEGIPVDVQVVGELRAL